MDAVEFLKALDRRRKQEVYFCDYNSQNVKEAVDEMKKWSAEHPVKSYLDVYKEAMKEKFGSNIKDGASITRSICRDKAIYGCFCRHEQPVSQIDCIDCWHSECKLPIKGE